MDGLASVLAVLAALAGVGILAVVAIYVSKDMDSRGKPGWVYGMATFIAPPVGLTMWLVVRSRFPSRR